MAPQSSNLRCVTCGDPATLSVLADPFGKSYRTLSYCAAHAPQALGWHGVEKLAKQRNDALKQVERVRAALQIARDELVQYIDFQRKSDYLEYAAESQKKLDAINAALSGDSSAPEACGSAAAGASPGQHGHWCRFATASAPETSSSGWMSVEDYKPRMTLLTPMGYHNPSARQFPVLAATKEGRVFQTIYNQLGFANLNSSTDYVTHWMALPAHPSAQETNTDGLPASWKADIERSEKASVPRSVTGAPDNRCSLYIQTDIAIERCALELNHKGRCLFGTPENEWEAFVRICLDQWLNPLGLTPAVSGDGG